MYLLYADESGTPGGSDQEHFVLAGITVFERKSHWLSEELNAIATKFCAQDPNSIELHGAPMLAGRKIWRQFKKADRLQAIKDALSLIDGRHYRVIASVIKKDVISPEEPVRYAFQQLISRFDHFLARQYRDYDNKQRGLVLFDKSSKEAPIQSMATEFKRDGHEWGKLRNMAEIPAFIDSKATRLIQLADLVAYALFRHYEKQDSQFYDIIKKKFDSHGGVRHGLHTATI